MTALNAKPYPCLWCKDGVEEPAQFYQSVFKGAREVELMKTPKIEGDNPGNLKEGEPMVSVVELNGQRVMLLNGGGHSFEYNESVSLVIDCGDQAEVDYYWNALIADGGRESQCGWLKDKYGMNWQVTPTRLIELMTDADKEKAGRVMAAMLQMSKIEIEPLERAAAGG